MPELDSYKYNDEQSYVCSSFVTDILRAGGLFKNLSINASEFTPKDLYELHFWDISKKRIPKNC